mgnify:CR=1 FL=1
MKLDTEMVNIVAETYEKLGMSDKAERVRLKYPASAYRWRSIDGRTKRIPIRQPFIVSKFNPSTQGNVVNFINHYFYSVCAFMYVFHICICYVYTQILYICTCECGEEFNCASCDANWNIYSSNS